MVSSQARREQVMYPKQYLKIVHTVASLNSSSGGPARTITALCEALAKLNVETRLITQCVEGLNDLSILPLPELVQTSFVKAWRIPYLGAPYSPRSRAALWKQSALLGAQLIHNHGLWLPFNHDAAMVASRLGVPLIISPRGMAEPWALKNRAWKKQLAWLAYQKADLRHAQVVHATSLMEARNLRSLGFTQPIALIPNAVDIPARSSERADRNIGTRTALFLSRIHPKKGLLHLVRAWNGVRPKGWRVLVVGPDESNHRVEVEREIDALQLRDIFSFRGSVDDVEKWNCFFAADLFILPSLSENFGVVAAEALASGVPVITTKGTPWEDLFTYKCGWWVDIGVEPLANAIREATNLSDAERSAMGKRGRDLIRRQYDWQGVAEYMSSVYEWVIYGGTPPKCVVND